MLYSLIFVLAVAQVPDGTIVALRSERGLVHRITDSSITHVGVVFNHGDMPWVYDCYRPEVRRMPWPKYLDFVHKQYDRNPTREMLLLRPRENYSSAERKSMLEYAVSQLGRPYGIGGYVFGKPRVPMDCSWYVMEVLMRSGRYFSPEPWKLSPGELVDQVSGKHFPPEHVEIEGARTHGHEAKRVRR